MTPLSLGTIARALNGELSGRRVRFSPPGHSRIDRSAWFEIAPALSDGFYVGSFTGDDPLAIKDYVKQRLGLPSGGFRRPNLAASSTRQGTDRTALALKIWRDARDPDGSPVEVYLTSARPQGRGVELPVEAAGEAIRFHPNCRFGRVTIPAMVCLVRDVRTNEPKAIHRTALTTFGTKTEIDGFGRLSLGPLGGGAIKLTPDEDVTTCLGVGEGVESTLSLRATPEFGASPIWSLISANGIEKLPVLPRIESLWIAVDNDVSGRGPGAARACAERWQAAGREVFLVKPTTPGLDLNDIPSGAPHV
jgi:hypothetical protein